MENIENLEKELNSLEYAIESINEAIDYVEEYSDDCDGDIDLLNDVIKSFNYICDNLRNEIEEEKQNTLKENLKEIEAMNIEFERSRL
jgi:peptidoglycan hydrolase CwlO-like protein